MFSIVTYINRYNLDYNEAGRFFDSQDEVVYHEQDKELYGLAAVFLSTITVLTIAFTIKRFSRSNR